MDIIDTDVDPGIAEAPAEANTQVDTTDRPGPSAPPPSPPVSQSLTLNEKQRICFWVAAQPLLNGARPSYIRIRRYFSAKYNGRLLEQQSTLCCAPVTTSLDATFWLSHQRSREEVNGLCWTQHYSRGITNAVITSPIKLSRDKLCCCFLRCTPVCISRPLAKVIY